MHSRLRRHRWIARMEAFHDGRAHPARRFALLPPPLPARPTPSSSSKVDEESEEGADPPSSAHVPASSPLLLSEPSSRDRLQGGASMRARSPLPAAPPAVSQPSARCWLRRKRARASWHGGNRERAGGSQRARYVCYQGADISKHAAQLYASTGEQGLVPGRTTSSAPPSPSPRPTASPPFRRRRTSPPTPKRPRPTPVLPSERTDTPAP